MNDQVPLWIYKRWSNDFSRPGNPVRLHQFSQTPGLKIPRGANKAKVLRARLERQGGGSLEKYREKVTKAQFSVKVKDLEERKIILPPIRFVKKEERNESDDDDSSIQEFLKRWNYIQ